MWARKLQIRLADLFACDEQGTLLVAQHRETGEMLHIDEVMRGLKCDCVCPSCSRLVVARQGKRRHSFAHHADDVRRSCSSAGETLLHRIAKDALAKHLYIVRPEVKTSDELGDLILAQREPIRFDRIELEKREGNVVPDVVCYLGDRRLYVEFKVTHAVDDNKRAKLREHDAAVLEIDLQAYRQHDVTDLDKAILEDAPRVMIQTAIMDKAEERLAARQAAAKVEREREREKAKRKVQQLVRRFQELPDNVDLSGQEWMIEALRHEIPDLLPPPSTGSTPFKIAQKDWSIWLMWAILQERGYVSAKQLAYQMTKLDWVKRDLYDPDADTMEIGRQIDPRFTSAVYAVDAFLLEMEALALVRSLHGARAHVSVEIGQWTDGTQLKVRPDTDRFIASPEFRAWFDEKRKSLQRHSARQEKIAETVFRLVNVAPPADSRKFGFERWIERLAASLGKTCIDELLDDEAACREALRRLDGLLAAMSSYPPRMPESFVGLPLQGYFEDKIAQWETREANRKADEARLRAEQSEQRVQVMVELASRRLGISDEWVNKPVAFEGMELPPPQHSRRSPEAHSEMRRLLQLEVDAREDALAAARLKEQWQNKLFMEARKVLGSDEVALMWFRCPHPQLGKRRPSEYCVNEETFNESVSLLPSPKKKRR